MDPSGLKALSIAGGGRKRAKECIAAALGLGVEEEEEEEEEEALHPAFVNVDVVENDEGALPA